MANGIITLGSTNSKLEGRIVWESASHGPVQNLSYVAGHLQVRRNDGYTTKGTWTGAMNIGGEVHSFSNASTSVGSDWVTMLEFYIYQPHNNDGTGNCYFEAYCNGPAGTSMAGHSVSGSQTVTLDFIARASQPTLSNGSPSIGSSTTVYMNRASTSFTHNVYCVWGNKTITVGTGVTDQVSFTIPKDFADNIPNSVSGTGTFWVDTFYNGTLIGSKGVQFTGNVPDTSEFQPSILSVSLVEAVEGIAEQFSTYIQNRSKIAGEITANGAYSSTIKTYKVVVNGTTYNEKSFTTDFLKLAGINSIAVTVTDSRGRTATLTKTFEVLAYEGPSITKFLVNRCNEDGTLNDEGEYAKIEIASTIPSLNDKNTYSYNLQYKDTDDTSYTEYEIELIEVTTDTSINLSGSCIIPADSNNSFEYLLIVTDYFMTINKVNDIGTAFQLINFNASGRGMAFGKVSEKNAFEINMPTYYKDCELVDLIYPVGSIYLTVNNINPSTWLGGTWEIWGSGRVPVGVDTTQTEFAEVEQTGGNKTQALRALIGATHDSPNRIGYQATPVVHGAGGYTYSIVGNDLIQGISHINHTTKVVQSDASEPTTIQPYITCYMWKRTA